MASYHFSVKSGKPGTAANHAAYIAREGRHAQGEKSKDLMTKMHGNLPGWAEDNPFKFWRTADRNERVNGATYREYEIALPNELSLAQNLELVLDFIKHEVGDKPFQFAIHAPHATLGEVEQPHAHIMLSDRQPDGINRSPDRHFRRFNPTNPELGGCKKDSGGRHPGTLKDELISRRENLARLQNTHLEKHGHAARVDHRSNRERGIKVEPERHLGHVALKLMSAQEKDAYLSKRQNNQPACA